MDEFYRPVKVPQGGAFWRKMLAFAGPGYLVAVGYMDPGNWATDIAGGSAFGYSLLSVILISNFMAMILQALAARLGVVSGFDLAQACRRFYPRPASFALWVLCEIAICACDLAEIIGTAIALNLLFGIPLLIGILLTACDTLLILFLQNKGVRYLEAFVMALIVIVAACFGVELLMARPEIGPLFAGFVPSAEIVRNPQMLYIAIGIIGATVMPHNLYLHSAIVRTRSWTDDSAGKREAIRLSAIDSTVALLLALFINAAILIMAAAVFHKNGLTDVAEIQQAHSLLAPLLGTGVASVLFALALLASGQNSTITATLAGQIVMEGFLSVRVAPWLRRLMTRLLALVPAVAVCALYGESGTAKLLVLSQVILSMQLPFAVVPLAQFASSRKVMGELKAGPLLMAASWLIAAIIICLNVILLMQL
jgi:manganese transport protein